MLEEYQVSSYGQRWRRAGNEKQETSRRTRRTCKPSEKQPPGPTPRKTTCDVLYCKQSHERRLETEPHRARNLAKSRHGLENSHEGRYDD